MLSFNSFADILDSDNFLKAVPVMNLNYRDGSNLVNVNSNPAELVDDKFTRRFFVFDNLSARKDSAQAPEVIRFAESITIESRLQFSSHF